MVCLLEGLTRPVAATGSWQITYAYSGSTTVSSGMYGSSQLDWAQLGGIPYSYGYVFGSYTGHAVLDGTVTVTGTWCDTGGGHAPVPAYFLIQANAGWSASGAQAPVVTSHSASNGIWHPETLTDGGTQISGTSAGKRLVQVRDGDTWSRSYSLHAAVDLHPGSGGFATFTASAGLTAAVDSRGATIASSADLTYRREVIQGQPVRTANLPDLEGVTRAHSLRPLSIGEGSPLFQELTYHANAAGPWSGSSEYHWHASMVDDSAWGGFSEITPVAHIPDFRQTYFDPPAAPATTEHIFLHLIDAFDGADCSTNHYVTWHSKYEDWCVTSQTNCPRSLEQFPYDWAYMMAIDNSTSMPLTQGLTTTRTLTRASSGSIGGEVSSDYMASAFKLNENITVNETVSVTVTEATTWTAAPWTRTECFGAMSCVVLTGTCSVWDTHGYVGERGWNGERVTPYMSKAQRVTDWYTPH